MAKNKQEGWMESKEGKVRGLTAVPAGLVVGSTAGGLAGTVGGLVGSIILPTAVRRDREMLEGLIDKLANNTLFESRTNSHASKMSVFDRAGCVGSIATLYPSFLLSQLIGTGGALYALSQPEWRKYALVWVATNLLSAGYEINRRIHERRISAAAQS